MRATVLLLLAGSSVLGACADTGPSVTANIPMTSPDGTIYYVKVVCRPAVTYSAPVASASVSVPSAGSATVKVDNAILQPTDQASRALDFEQYKACQEALLHPGTDSSFGTTTAPPARPPVTTPELDTAAGTSNSGSANRDNAVMTVSAGPSKVETNPPPADQPEE
jgi:hypothetical protein